MQPRKRLLHAVEAVREKLPKLLNDADLRLFKGAYSPLLVESIQDIVVEMCNKIRDRHRVSNDIVKYNSLAHYTSLGTVVKMLRRSKGEENDYLRLYDSSHFNDPDEGNYLLNLLQVSEPSQLNESIKGNMEGTKQPSYIASFVSDQDNENMHVSDQLVFWRTYGREGKGCSVQFVNLPKDKLMKVFYGGSEEAKKTINTLLDTWREILNILDPISYITGERFFQEELADIIIKELEVIRYLYKNKAYRYENEVRLVVTESYAQERGSEIKFDIIDGDEDKLINCIKLYYEFKELATDNIFGSGSSITLGPCIKDAYNTRCYLEHLEREANLLGIDIKFSQIRYRQT